MKLPTFATLEVFVKHWSSYWKWTQWCKFKSWTRLFAFPITLILFEKEWIQLFSLQLWVKVEQTGHLHFGMANGVKEGKLWIQAYWTLLKNKICVVCCLWWTSYVNINKYVHIYIYVCMYVCVCVCVCVCIYIYIYIHAKPTLVLHHGGAVAVAVW